MLKIKTILCVVVTLLTKKVIQFMQVPLVIVAMALRHSIFIVYARYKYF